MAYEDERLIAQATLLAHYQNLLGYTRSAVTQAITEIRQDYPVAEGEEPTGIAREMLRRAESMERSLAAIDEATGG